MHTTVEVAGGSAQASRIDGHWILQSDREHIGELASAVAEHRDGGPLRWVVSAPTGADESAALAAGLRPVRDVLQLRRSLPVEPRIATAHRPVTVRAFRPGTDDEAAWITCNNRAFANHADQARYTVDRLHRVMAEPWFDPAGFLLHEHDSQLAAFCWTKIHRDVDPPLGEIFVIGVDPEFAGRGLGGSITLAGLAHLVDQGLTTGMLYVDTGNASARRMYDRLRFTLHHVDRIFEADPDAA